MVKTDAPAARTPVLRETQTRDHLAVLGGMTPAGKLSVLARQRSGNGWDIIEFLWQRGRVASARRLLIWDGSPIHRRAEVNEFVSETRAKSGWRRCRVTHRT